MNRLRDWITLNPELFRLVSTILLVLTLLVFGTTCSLAAPPNELAVATKPFASVSDAVSTSLTGTPFTAFDDVVTFSIPTGVQFKVWFGAPADDPLKPEYVQFRRTRREGGLPFTSAFIHKPAWVPDPNGNPTLFGLVDALPRAGHYHYEARLCTAPSDANENDCSVWSSSLDPKVGYVGDKPRAWWIYGYLAPAGTPQL